MKYIFLIIFLSVTITAQSQEYLGTWSFESVDREAIDTDSMNEEELEKRIGMVSNMFGSLKLNIDADMTYSLTMMGQAKSFPYAANENILLLNNGDKLEVLTEDKAKFSSGKMVLFLQKGDVTIEKTYTYLTSTTYENQKLDSKELIGKWKVEEVRVPKDTEGAEIMEMVGMMISLNFISDTDMSFGAMGMETVKKYRIEANTNKVITTEDSGEENTIYIIHELDEKSMIVSHIKEGMLLYLIKE